MEQIPLPEPTAEVVCRVSPDCTRLDLRVGSVTYRGAAIWGSGGLVVHAQDVARHLRQAARRGLPVNVCTYSDFRRDEWVTVPGRDVEVLAVQPVDRHAR